jgi:excisionase family DNA binding protein
MSPPALNLAVHRQAVRALPGPQPLAGHGMETLPNRLELLFRDLAHETEFRGATALPVREAAQFLGVSSQTVYLWVERRQIPHLRVMGRNIRFLKSDLEPFRSRFKQEVENGQTK